MGLPVARLGFLSAALVLLLRGGCTGSSSHSLRIFYTLVMGSNQDVPQYIVLGYVDDQLASRFDPAMRRMLPLVPWLLNVKKEDLHFWDFISQRVSITEHRFKSDLAILHRYHNSSRGTHSWQCMTGCQLSKDGHKQGYLQYGYNGEDFISLDQKTLTWTAVDVRAQVIKRRWEAEPFITQNRNNFLEKECIQLLQKCMVYGKDSLLRKEPPVVKVSHRIQYNSMETLVCQIYGFYPKEMDATWRKDGEVWEQDTFRGGVLPNSDGTYHAWLSIEVDPKERDHYRCYVDHAGLPEPLVLAWKEPAFVSNLGFISGIVAAVLIAVGVIVCIKKCGRNAYRAASDQWRRLRKKSLRKVTTWPDQVSQEKVPSPTIYGTEDETQSQAMLQPKVSSEHEATTCGGQRLEGAPNNTISTLPDEKWKHLLLLWPPLLLAGDVAASATIYYGGYYDNDDNRYSDYYSNIY